MISTKYSPWTLFSAVAITVVLLWTVLASRRSEIPHAPWIMSASRKGIDTTSEIGRSSNATLGFEKVFVIGLKERFDKRDAMVLSSSLTGFHVEFVDALKGEDVSKKYRPQGNELQDGALGSWRSHMNTVRSVIENGLSSAFIMEDDVDWDVRLLSQMPNFAKGVRSLSNIPISTPQASPYGDDWDVLWPGHCGEYAPANDGRRYIIGNDETVAPKSHQTWLKGLLNDYPDYTRIVHKSEAPICVFGYAVSNRGAQKIMMALALRQQEFNLAFDNALAFFCRDGFLDIKCYSVVPELFHHHRPAGNENKDSDIQGGDDTKVREKGFTENIVLSARLNMEQMILGSQNWTRQW